VAYPEEKRRVKVIGCVAYPEKKRRAKIIGCDDNVRFFHVTVTTIGKT
jgi:hypothetical protein